MSMSCAACGCLFFGCGMVVVVSGDFSTHPSYIHTHQALTVCACILNFLY